MLRIHGTWKDQDHGSPVLTNLRTPAGFGWQIGWYFEMAWQLVFVQDTPEAMWVSAVLLLGAFLGFSITLLSLYRCVLIPLQGRAYQHTAFRSPLPASDLEN
jgi:hypothetical protein